MRKQRHKTACLVLVVLILLTGNVQAREDQAYGPIPFSQHFALDRAAKLMDSGKIQEAITLLEDVVKAAKNHKIDVHPLVQFNLGNAFLIQNQPEKAIPVYNACLAQAPLFSLAWLNLAKACFDLNLFSKAGDAMLRGYETSTRKNPDHLYYAAAAYLSAKSYDKALSILEKPFKTTESAAAVTNLWREALVHVYLALEQPGKALIHIQYLAEHTDGKDRLQWQETLLYQYMSLGMNVEALAYVTYLTTQYPDEPRWWKGMAHFYLGENNYTAALTAMTIYGYLTPFSMAEKRLTADLNLSVGIPARAADLYEEIFKENPSPELVVKIIQAMEQMNAGNRALAWAEKGLADYPEDREIAMLRGELLFSEKRYGDSADVFRHLAKTDNTGKAWLMLGYSAWNLSDIKTARQAMERASSFKTYKSQAKKALALMNGS
ncbi:MAG: tetratricopeptide repeat protein [Pseudomonadota bacterium]